MVCEETLKIKNLPKELTDVEKEDFIKHFGATKVKVITSKAKQKSVVFARFESKEVARQVLFRLHQTYVLKNRLSVEYADQDLGLPKIKTLEEATDDSKAGFKQFLDKLNAFNHSVDFQQPPPPHLKYVYPKANRLTINNIGHALASVPKFYTQVLHLMNRMNLPPPFAVEPKAAAQAKPPQPQVNNKSSSESELESDEESKQRQDVIPQKRSMPQKKAIKRPKFHKPQALPPAAESSSSSSRPDDVFDKSEVQVQKKIEMKVSATLDPRKSDTQTVVDSKQIEIDDPEKTATTTITAEELAFNQIKEKDLSVLPVFKNYHCGAPSCRLYIKNIAKTVEMKDLEYIYNRYKLEGSEGGEQFEIKLMLEGRMKGQAFVTLGSVQVAQKALKETNGYILKDKPLVVVFAKSITKK